MEPFFMARAMCAGRSADPIIVEPTDAIVRTVAGCVCGSDLWPYRGMDEVTAPGPIGHEYCGIVAEVGEAVTAVKPASS